MLLHQQKKIPKQIRNKQIYLYRKQGYLETDALLFLFEKRKICIAVREGETIEFSIETRFCFQKQIARTEFFEKDGFFALN
jgi:hypothetical protein